MAVLSLAAMFVAIVFAILELTFTVGVTTWAVGEASRMGTTPELYEVLNDGLLDRIQFVYTILGFAAQAGFAVALLKTRMLARWIGTTALIWSLIWLALDPGVFGIPAILVFMPAGIGVALLTTRETAAQPRRQKEAIHG